MDDRISKLLSDPESLKTLSVIAKGLFGGDQQDSAPPPVLKPESTVSEAAPAENESGVLPESNTESEPSLPASLIGQSRQSRESTPHNSSFDNRAALLKSIKPYLAEGKRQRVDSLVTAINIAKVINEYTDSGDFFKGK